MSLVIRQAVFNDLEAIVRMLADDFLGGTREKVDESISENYIKAFREIENDPNNELIVAVLSEPPAVAGGLTQPDDNGVSTNPLQPPATAGGSDIVGTFQLTYTPSLSFQGGKRCTVESVRVDSSLRGRGIGRKMMLWAVERAKEKGCVSMQLTTHKERENAHRFYEKLGFQTTHLGMKLTLK